jgi:hypothetical protein
MLGMAKAMGFVITPVAREQGIKKVSLDLTKKLF